MKIRKLVSLWTKHIKRDVVMLWFARKHPDTPLRAKAVGALTILYVLSPIDLVPDFIPLLGYLDDALVLPAMIWLAIRMLPSPVLAASRVRADDWIRVSGFKLGRYIGGAILLTFSCLIAYLYWRSH